jgi:hypothetical protein
VREKSNSHSISGRDGRDIVMEKSTKAEIRVLQVRRGERIKAMKSLPKI